MRLFQFLVAFLLLLSNHAQDGKFDLGARNSGMGCASVTLGDPYSLFNNIGGLAQVKEHHVFGGYQNRYGISELQVLGAGAIYHSSIGNVGLGFYRFGGELFSQQRIHLAVGNQFQLVSLGLGVDLIQYDVSTVGTKQVVSLQFGGIAEITRQLQFGAHIFNLNLAELVEETGERVPTIMKAGISYRPSNELMINIEVEKDLDFDEIIKAGIEYELVEAVFVRTGVITEPFTGTFGIGFYPKQFLFDYSYVNNSTLGAIHEVSLGYRLVK